MSPSRSHDEEDEASQIADLVDVAGDGDLVRVRFDVRRVDSLDHNGGCLRATGRAFVRHRPVVSPSPEPGDMGHLRGIRGRGSIGCLPSVRCSVSFHMVAIDLITTQQIER